MAQRISGAVAAPKRRTDGHRAATAGRRAPLDAVVHVDEPCRSQLAESLLKIRWQQREERDFGDYGGAVRDGAAQQSRISFGEPRLDVRHPAVLAGHVLAACAQKRTVLAQLFPAYDADQGL